MGVYVNVRTCTNSIESGSSIADLGGGGWVSNMCTLRTLPIEHVHKVTWACARFQLSMRTLFGEHMHTYAMHTFQLSKCTLLVEHVHASSWACSSWAYAHSQVSMCTSEHMHTSACTRSNWACAHFQLCMHMLPVEHVHASSWACTHFQVSMCMPWPDEFSKSWPCWRSTEWNAQRKQF